MHESVDGWVGGVAGGGREGREYVLLSVMKGRVRVPRFFLFQHVLTPAGSDLLNEAE